MSIDADHGPAQHRRAPRSASVVAALVTACGTLAAGASAQSMNGQQRAAEADQLLVVDCLLPGQVRNLGQRSVYVSARRPARITARDCQIRGGEYVAYDRADLQSALAAWLPSAEQGDVEAQVIVGEIYERGLGVAPDFVAAARWYRLAAEAGSTRAQVNLGHLYEMGLGVDANPRTAIDWYRRAAGSDGAIEIDPEATAVATAQPAAPDRSQEIAALQQELAARSREAAALQGALEKARAEEAERLRALEAGTEATVEARAAVEVERTRLGELAAQLSQREGELAAQRAETERLGRELTALTALAADRQQQIARLEAPVREQLVAGPELALIEPQVVATRDIVPVAVTQGAERQIVGRVTAPAGLVAVTVNDAAVTPNELGVFSTKVTVSAGDSPVRIVAVDRQGKRGELRFLLRTLAADLPRAADADDATARKLAASVDFGSYHALLIGNNDYRSLPDLASPVNDVTDLSRTLEQRYGFKTTVLLNADRYQILSALNTLRETLTVRDNLLVYFAGHGELDEVNQRGHWLPVDAERDSTANWIPTTAVTDILNIMKAKQILLVVDSCYAGALTRSAMGRLGTGMTDAERLHWYRTMASKRSRTVLTSGGLAPVMDAGGGRHSVFAKALLEVLDANADAIDGQRLHREVAARVAYAAANLRFDQVPEYAPIRYAGHEAGEFFLVPSP